MCWEKIGEEIFFWYFFWFLTWDKKPGFTPNKPTYYLLDYVEVVYVKAKCIELVVTYLFCFATSSSMAVENDMISVNELEEAIANWP